MIKNRTELANIEQALVDESLYTEASRKDEMKRLLQRQAALKSALETLEWEWLEASEKLEEAEKEL